jgi:hypothetical protein
MCSERVGSSCSTSDTRRIALIIVLIETNDVITYNYVSVVFCSGIFLLHFTEHSHVGYFISIYFNLLIKWCTLLAIINLRKM